MIFKYFFVDENGEMSDQLTKNEYVRLQPDQKWSIKPPKDSVVVKEFKNGKIIKREAF